MKDRKRSSSPPEAIAAPQAAIQKRSGPWLLRDAPSHSASVKSAIPIPASSDTEKSNLRGGLSCHATAGPFDRTGCAAPAVDAIVGFSDRSDPMAGGWTRDGAVQDQIDASVADAVKRARSRLPQGDGSAVCEDCGGEIPEARRRAVPGVRRCVGCQAEVDEA